MRADSITAAVAGSADGWLAPEPTRSLDIDPIDRMLLTADGTVTTLLEACTGEPIVTRTTRHAGPGPLDRVLAAGGRWWHPDARLLGLEPPERLIARRVVLTGARSAASYVLAESLVASDRLPGATADHLMHAGSSLGRLLAGDRLETRREVVDIVAVRAGAAGDHLGIRCDATLARRTYTIGIGRRVVAAVTEWLVPGRLTALTRRADTGGATARRPFIRTAHVLPPSRPGVEFVADL